MDLCKSSHAFLYNWWHNRLFYTIISLLASEKHKYGTILIVSFFSCPALTNFILLSNFAQKLEWLKDIKIKWVWKESLFKLSFFFLHFNMISKWTFTLLLATAVRIYVRMYHIKKILKGVKNVLKNIQKINVKGTAAVSLCLVSDLWLAFQRTQ